MHGRAGADVVQVGRLRRILPRIPLRDHQDRLLFAERLDELDGALPPDRERKNCVGKKHRVPHWQNRNGRPRLDAIRLVAGFAPVGLMTLTKSLAMC